MKNFDAHHQLKAQLHHFAGVSMPKIRSAIAILFLLPALAVPVSCSASSKSQQNSTATTACPTQTCRVIKEVSVGAGKACSVNGDVGPPTFSAWDLGKPGIPDLNGTDARMLGKIMKYVHPKSLRFAFVGGRFIVFDSYPGLCNGGSPFVVLNGGCDENYAITDVPDGTIGGGDMGCVNHPRPWIPHDKGVGSPDAWLYYDNSH